MWEFLLKLNPNLIRFTSRSRNNFEELMDIAVENGYIPSFRDVSGSYEINDYVDHHPTLMEKMLEKDPRTIVALSYADDKVVKKAMDLGYKPRVRDVKNRYLSSCDLVMRELIKINPKNIIYYEGSSEKLIEYALSVGWKPTKRDIKKNYVLSYSEAVMRFLIDKNPNNIVLYEGNSSKLIEYAIKRGYKPTIRDIKKDCIVAYDIEIMRRFIRDNPKNIAYYRGKDSSLIQEALSLGYVPTIADIQETSLGSSKEIMRILISQNPRNVLYYEGRDFNLVKEAIELGFRPNPKELKFYYDLFHNDSVYRLLIQKDPNYVAYCDVRDPNIILEAMNLGYKPKVLDVKDNYYLSKNEYVIKYLLEQDPRNIVLYNGKNSKLVDEALSLGYVPILDDVKISWSLSCNERVMRMLIEKNPKAICYYKGSSQEIFDYALSKGYVSTVNDILNEEYTYLRKSDRIMKMMVEQDCKLVRLYRGENQELIDLAIKKGYKPSKTDIRNNNLLARNKIIVEMLLNEDISNLNFYKTLGDDAMLQALQIFEASYGINIPDYYADVFQVYHGDVSKFCLNYKRFIEFLGINSISEEVFFQYAFSKSYDWLKDIMKISTGSKLDEFKQIKDYFFENYYSNISDKQGAVAINAFLDILKNYTSFPELCRDIISQNRPLIEEEKMNLSMVFTSSSAFDDGNKPMSILDLNNVVLNIKEVYREKLNCSVKDGAMKDALCQLLFNASVSELNNRLEIFGDTQVLRQLLFNNRKNPDMIAHIKKMMLFTSMIEDILVIDDPKLLKVTIDRVLDNFEIVFKQSLHFGRYEEKMRYLYEMDIQSNLTRVSNISDMSSVIDKAKTEKYGVEVLDFSDKRYCLLAHVMSRRETPEELIEGKAVGNKNFICLSSISNRNQVYYTNPGDDKIIFATDVMPEGLFLQSSVTNMGSNGHIGRNGGDVSEMDRIQRGILETSHAPNGNNSEIFAYRGGLKFKYIVLPGGREPTETELSLAKERGLKFIVTQNVRETINTPVEILMKSDEGTVFSEKSEERVQQIGSGLFTRDTSLRRIAILTDAHGLFEPTLAVLEDARKRGIKEIYSLGDNIGTGPNPSEVMDILDEYGVVSILGNHELYVSLGVDAFKNHLDHAGAHAYSEAKRNSTWTASQLREDQKQRLRITKKMINLTLGGKNILLCHDVKDFNTGEVIVDSSVYDEVFRGHIHFDRSEGNITTIPGVGIGTNAGSATYMILTEKEGGGYIREVVTVEYDKTNMRYGIIESSMSEGEKDKISRWAGVSIGTRKR